MPDLNGAAGSAYLDRGGSIWVLSDVHANGEAFDAALKLVPEDAGIVVLGDLLTYGCQPVEVMAQVAELRGKRDVALVLGNHDQLYIDLFSGDVSYYEKLPAWIRETVDWTLELADPKWWDKELGWCKELVVGGILLDHANPERYGNWQYLNTRGEHSAALEKLVKRGCYLGVFGHTHRAKCLHASAVGERFYEREVSMIMQPGDRAIVNAGSVGQPRGPFSSATALEIKGQAQGLRIRHHPVKYDLDAHLTAIRESSLSEATRGKLCSYFDASVP